jgi:hypothetical protein
MYAVLEGKLERKRDDNVTCMSDYRRGLDW